jgi:hypothetical protein
MNIFLTRLHEDELGTSSTMFAVWGPLLFICDIIDRHDESPNPNYQNANNSTISPTDR